MNEQVKAARELLFSIGMVESTSPQQRKKGTLRFADPLNSYEEYTLHANGYYRKAVDGGNYQLNRTMITKNKYSHSVSRILIPGQYLLMASRIVKIVLNSRNR